jgi:hypothetical protein
MNVAKRLRLRLFIELVEVPCIAVQVSVQPNSPMMAAIQIPPMQEGTQFHPRSLVHVFFYDFEEAGASVGITKTGTSVHKTAGPTIYEDEMNQSVDDVGTSYTNEIIQDISNQKYKLLFVGELAGFTWSKSPTSRSLVLQCMDPSNYWDYAYQYNNTDLFGPGYKAMFSGGSTNLFTDFLDTPGGVAVQIIKTPSTRYPQLKGLLGGIIHLMEAMGGSYYYEKKYAGQNIFFSIAELRLRLTQMVTAYEKDPTGDKLLGGSYDGLFGRGIGNLGEQASYRKIISMLSGVIFHEVFPQSCPYYRPGTQISPSGFKRKSIQQMAVFGPIALSALGLRDSVQAVIDGLNEGTEAKTFVSNLTSVRQQCGVLARTADSEVYTARTKKVPNVALMAQKLSSILRTSATSIGRAITTLNSSKGKTANVISDLTSIYNTLDEIQSLQADVTSTGYAAPPILCQQIIKPDVWFSAPPRCNVIFPDQYMQLDYSRQFLAEPTRLLLKTNDEFFGEDELFDSFYFAPKAITLKSEANTLQAVLRGDILDHELFTGILPVFEKMGEFNIFAARSGRVNGQTPKVGLAQRSCNFLYFKHRFAARQMSFTGRFNPYIAFGFPGLVLDKWVDIESVRRYNELIATLPAEYSSAKREVNALLGTHFLANFTQGTHNVDAKGQGMTQVSCGYARQPEETVEFLGVEQSDVSGSKKLPGTATRETDVASIYAPKVNGTGPMQGRITAVQDVTDVYSTEDGVGKELPLYQGTRDKQGNLDVKVSIAEAKKASEFGPDVSSLMGDPDLVVMFNAYRVTEEIARSKSTGIDLPPEEYIRPGWYGDCWHPSKISEVYYDFFNTGSIAEPIQVQNTDGSQDGLVSSDASSTITSALSGDMGKVSTKQSVQLSLTQDSSIENAVAYLALTYSVIKQAGFNTDAFIQSYCWRPIATMLDMFGTYDLQFSSDGERVLRGVEGFHSRAAGPYENLFGIIVPNIEEIVGVKRGSPQSQKADKRKAKREKVLAYTARLRVSRAILG